MVRPTHYRPGQALRIPTDWGSKISRQSENEGDKFVRSTRVMYIYKVLLIEW
jgi:hypothetical protein